MNISKTIKKQQKLRKSALSRLPDRRSLTYYVLENSNGMGYVIQSCNTRYYIQNVDGCYEVVSIWESVPHRPVFSSIAESKFSKKQLKNWRKYVIGKFKGSSDESDEIFVAMYDALYNHWVNTLSECIE